MSQSKFDKDLIILHGATTNCILLVRAFQSQPAISSPNLGPPPHPNPLAVLSDASKILKAQTTKLTLLLLNKPFSPGEIAHIINALANSCLPALVTVLDLCPGHRYTHFLRRHISACLSSIWRELLALLGSIPRDEESVGKLESEGPLLSTGVLWEACDQLVKTGVDGVVPVGSDAIKESQALLQDAIDELDEWDPEGDEEDDSEDDDDDDKDNDADDTKSTPAVYTPTTSDDEALTVGMRKTTLNPMIETKARALKHLRLVRLLYPAFTKHRIKTFQNIDCSTNESALPSIANVKIFDSILQQTRAFTEEADEIAGALYSGDREEVDRRLQLLMAKAKSCVITSRLSYDGNADPFSEWSQKWIARAEELAS